MSTILFGVNVSTSAAAGADPVADARQAEAAGQVADGWIPSLGYRPVAELDGDG
jgi:hypothetical protein